MIRAPLESGEAVIESTVKRLREVLGAFLGDGAPRRLT